jgi:autoinducer 2-degrading protein
MRVSLRLLMLALMGVAAMPADAQSPGAAAASGPAYVVAYVEAAPAAADAVAGQLSRFAADAGKADGNITSLALREIGRASRFAFVTGWRGKDTLDRHGEARAALQTRLEADTASPFDERPSSALFVAAGSADQAPAGAIYVLTHVDVPPPSKDACIALLRQLTEASRAEPGALRVDVLQQDSRPNHFTVVEAWRDRAAHDSHVMAAHTREFRQKLTPMSGALYDERLYQATR